MKLCNSPTAQQAADFFSETPQHEIQRLRGHIKILEEVLSMERADNKELKQEIEDWKKGG